MLATLGSLVETIPADWRSVLAGSVDHDPIADTRPRADLAQR